ncbi:hypothetical protein D3C85_1471830 [compost metagenome]
MEVPTQSLQYSLTQTISVTGRARAVVRRPITLNSQNIATGIVGIFDRDINKITCHLQLSSLCKFEEIL